MRKLTIVDLLTQSRHLMQENGQDYSNLHCHTLVRTLAECTICMHKRFITQDNFFFFNLSFRFSSVYTSAHCSAQMTKQQTSVNTIAQGSAMFTNPMHINGVLAPTLISTIVRLYDCLFNTSSKFLNHLTAKWFKSDKIFQGTRNILIWF